MAPYIFGKRNLIHIIDLKATIKGMFKAYHFLERLAQRGETILFVGTKRQAGAVIKKEALRIGVPYVAERWLGGTLTNYDTIRKRLNRLREIEAWEKDGTLNRYSKKEQSSILREKRKLLRNLDGIRTLDRLPSCLVIIDPRHEAIAVQEADKIGAATVALIDTDGDPEKIDVPIPGNDDSMKVVQIVVAKLADAVAEGKAKSVGVARPAEGEAKPSSEEKPGAISVGRGGRPRRTTTGGRPTSITRSRPAPSSPVPTPPASPESKGE